MDVTVDAAPLDAKPVVARLLELNACELSPLTGQVADDEGRFGYPYLDAYWDGSPGRAAYLIDVGGRLGGFALVRPGSPHQMAEFFVLPGYRRRGVGLLAARHLFAAWPGTWLVHEVAGNHRAVAFWRRAITVPFTEAVDPTGTTQHFVQPGRPRPVADRLCQAYTEADADGEACGERSPWETTIADGLGDAAW